MCYQIAKETEINADKEGGQQRGYLWGFQDGLAGFRHPRSPVHSATVPTRYGHGENEVR